MSLVQMGPENGWISLACVSPEYRGRGFGVQLLGQAVQHTRVREGSVLRLVLNGSGSAGGFFRSFGFREEDAAEGGKTVLVKNIGYDPEYL